MTVFCTFLATLTRASAAPGSGFVLDDEDDDDEDEDEDDDDDQRCGHEMSR